MTLRSEVISILVSESSLRYVLCFSGRIKGAFRKEYTELFIGAFYVFLCSNNIAFFLRYLSFQFPKHSNVFKTCNDVLFSLPLLFLTLNHLIIFFV